MCGDVKDQGHETAVGGYLVTTCRAGAYCGGPTPGCTACKLLFRCTWHMLLSVGIQERNLACNYYVVGIYEDFFYGELWLTRRFTVSTVE